MSIEIEASLINKPKEHDLFPLSVSKAKTFSQCKAKYRFQYVDKLPKKDREYLSLGKFVHEVLENFYKKRIEGDEQADNVLLSLCCKDALINWKIKLSNESLITSKEMFEQFLIKIKKDKEDGVAPKVLCVEKEFYINLANKVLMLGFIDRIQLDSDGVLNVVDYKTSKSDKYLKKDYLQLQTYALVLFLENPDIDVVRGTYIMLRQNFNEIKFSFKREETMKIIDKFYQYYTNITDEKLYRHTVSPLCGYCDYIDNCKAGKSFLKIPDTSFGTTDWT